MLFVWLRAASCDLRIGTITATLWHALEDLVYFFLLLGVLLVMMASAGHLLVGTHLEAYSTVLKSIDAAFALLVAGDLSGLHELVRDDAPLPLALILSSLDPRSRIRRAGKGQVRGGRRRRESRNPPVLLLHADPDRVHYALLPPGNPR